MNSVEFRGPAENELVAEKYRLTRLIGRGGMGSVWEGVHITLGARVAVKFIDAGYADNDEARQRFENEAKAAAMLNSKYAVKVFDHGMMADGRPFIVMEYLTGEPLDERIQRLGRLEPAETASILAQVCRALSRAHAAGIVHRDLKPENVFLVRDEEDNADIAKVVDFGIAKFTANGLGISSSTRTGSVLGTPFYMSPEQARGLRNVDFHTDLWSLGVIAYRCIVGSLPFESESLGDLLVKICTAELPVPSRVAPWCPPGFDAWFARAMQREPLERFGSAQELSEQLMLVCGIAPMRQAQISSHEAYHRVSTPQQANLLAGTVPAPVVEGTTAPRVGDTGGGFAQTQGPGRSRKSVYWAAGGAVAVLGVLASIAAMVISRTDATASGTGIASAVGASAAESAGVAARAEQPVPAQTAASVPTPPTVAPLDAAVSASASASVPAKPPAVPAPAAAPRPPSGRTGGAQRNADAPSAPAPASPRRPSKAPIDLGY